MMIKSQAIRNWENEFFLYKQIEMIIRCSIKQIKECFEEQHFLCGIMREVRYWDNMYYVPRTQQSRGNLKLTLPGFFVVVVFGETNTISVSLFWTWAVSLIASSKHFLFNPITDRNRVIGARDWGGGQHLPLSDVCGNFTRYNLTSVFLRAPSRLRDYKRMHRNGAWCRHQLQHKIAFASSLQRVSQF